MKPKLQRALEAERLVRAHQRAFRRLAPVEMRDTHEALLKWRSPATKKLLPYHGDRPEGA